ncbi:MAG: hypothetical protein LBQ31_06650, partial [Bacteroidales bacterium]|nr:hypothetical protein [Bacteroidales bacterium]
MKHKKSTTTFFLLFMMLNTLLYSQDYAEYYSLTSTAYTHYVQKEYNEAIDKFKTAFDKFYPFFNDVETMKKCYLAIGDKEGAYQA